MCGILGQVSFKKNKLQHPKLSTIAHRGPDGQGEWTNEDESIYLGHTRLAIIDPTPTGKQPMQDASRRFTITFNGEIYNHQELRDLLPNINWRGNSDTETLVELYAEHQLKCLKKLKGMFAFAIHDAHDDSVTLVRDRLGIKPLWSKQTIDALSFSSEIRSLITPGDFSPNAHFLGGYIGFGRVPGSGEIMDGVSSIRPGNWMRITTNGIVEQKSWWPDNSIVNSKIRNTKSASKQVKQLVTKAIHEHLISDVGVGAFLSGGIDSSIVTLMAGKELGKNLKTFTVGFPQGDFDERAIARRVAKLSGSEHTEIEVQEKDCLEWVMQAVNCMDLPSIDAINTYIVSKAVRDTGVKVALSGLGGDELFAGYPSFKNIPMLSWLGSLPTSLSKTLMDFAPKALNEKLGGLSSYDIFELTRNRRRFTALKTLKQENFGLDEHSIPQAPLGLDTLGKISWAEIQSYMIPMLLRDSDQMSMAVGLEIRVPFLDHVLVEEALMIPQRFKKGKGVKPLLVEAFKNELPTEVYDRPKQGFELPMKDWIKGPLASFTNIGVQAASEWLSSEIPILQKENFDAGHVHWTRVWHWSVLGHWLLNQKPAEFQKKDL